MRRRTALLYPGVGALLVHACVLPHYGTDPRLDEQAAGGVAGATDGLGGAPPTTGAGGEGATSVTSGKPCTDDAALACVGAAQQGRLICQGGVWTPTDSCAEGQNCDQSTGDCAKLLDVCAGATRGQRFCGSNQELTECGPDLVTTKLVEACAETCVETGNTAECVPKSCGDHVRQAPEQCDDGNKDDTDDCTSACKVARCGDTAIWAGHEACDDGNAKTEACDYGQSACTVCNDVCQEESGATTFCGDGKWQSSDEECDAKATVTADQCNVACVLTTWALTPLPYVSPGSNYEYLADFVRDVTTGLTWQRQADPTDRTLVEAKAYCQALVLSGSSDWRLPTKVELMSLVDYTVPSPGPTLSTNLFEGPLADSFWTSSELLGSNTAFYVSFSSGSVGLFLKTVKTKVRCVH